MNQQIDVSVGQLENMKRKLNKIVDQLDLVNICNPTAREKLQKKYYLREIKRYEKEINKSIGLSSLPDLMW